MPKSSNHSSTVSPADAGARLDRWLADRSPDLSRSRVQKLILEGLVQVDGRVRSANTRLKADAEVTWTVPAPQPSHLDQDDEVGFLLVYEDEDLAVVDKPAGVVVHPAPGHARGTLVQGLLARLTSLSDVGGKIRPGLVHRLDKDTSGLLVVAKNDPTHRDLQRQIQERSLRRTYRALCWGVPTPPQGTIDLPLARHPRDRKRQAVRQGGRPASTGYRTERVLPGAALLQLSLQTGRTHQIRVHLSHRGHPVLGDALYGGGPRRLRGAAPEHRATLKAVLRVMCRQALHAARLGLAHPRTGELLDFESPLPDDFQRALQILSRSMPT